ncbi:MAG TPA: DUF1064 domain-containing protein [Syntrophales bacterium]|nr:DUF1064 domain-containing protein [Syntrophales bacterium]
MAYLVKYQYSKAKKQVFNGVRYDSGFEAGYAKELTLRKMAGEIKDFEAHKGIDLIVNNHKVGIYYIDFVVYNNDDTITYVETKGYPTPVWKLKWKIFEAMFADDPNVSLELIMQKQFKMRSAKRLN